MTQPIPAQPRSVILLPYPAVANLEPPIQSSLQTLGSPLSLARGQALYQAGEGGEAIYFVLEGLLKLSRLNEFGGEQLVGLMGPGDVLGLGSLGPGFHSEEARALSSLRLIRIERSQITRLLQHHPELSEHLLSALANRTQDLLELLELAQASVSVKISKALLWLSQRFGTLEASGWHRLELALRQEELASLVGVQRPTLTHSLTELRDLGVLRGTRGIYWLNRKALEHHLERLAWAA